MRAVRGVVVSSKRASLSEAASFAAADDNKEARPDIAAYIRRFRSALDELVRFHREIDPYCGDEDKVENLSGGVEGEVGDVGDRVLGSGSEEEKGRRWKKKKKKKRKREEGDDRERSGFDGGAVGDLGDGRGKTKKKKKKKKKRDRQR